MKNIKFTLFFLTIILISCAKKKAEEQATIDKQLIENYVEDNNLLGQFTSTGLWYSIQTNGTGVQAYNGATVKVIYAGFLLNGTAFDASENTGATFSLNNVIKGWQQGIPKFKEGGKGKLIIPSALGYGTQAQGSIPKNSVLIFNIELLEVL